MPKNAGLPVVWTWWINFFQFVYSRVTKEVDANSSEAKSLQKSEKSEAEVVSPVQKPAIG